MAVKYPDDLNWETAEWMPKGMVVLMTEKEKGLIKAIAVPLHEENKRLREALIGMDCTCLGLVPEGDNPRSYMCQRCLALRGEEV